MKIAISGSMAFDRMMRFPDHFQRHLLPEELHRVNVCFVVPTLSVDFGGCAGNIAYNLKLLGEEKSTFIVSALGKDSAPYRERLKNLGLSDDFIYQDETQFSAQAFITTDENGNQITFFHPGAMAAAQNVVMNKDFDLAIIAPSGLDVMLQHARECAALKIPFFFDPGQNLPLFDKELLREMMNRAAAFIVNDYEAAMLCERVELSVAEIAQKIEVLIVTHGEKGSSIFTENKEIQIAALAVQNPKDPTGCGDAYRAGLLYGRAHGWSWEKSGKLASVLGALKIECAGGQNHTPTLEKIAQRFEETFGEKML